MRLKQFIYEYFTFNKRERNGIIVLLLLIILLLICLSIGDLFIQPETIDFSSFKKELQAFERLDSIASVKAKKRTIPQNNNASSFHTERFLFDPDGLPQEEWKQLGLNEKQIRSIKKDETKGGKFYTKEDLLKPKPVDLNTADSLQLLSIKGIGPYFAKNIIHYRNQLGGFYKKEQLLEIWKFDKEKLMMIEKYIIIDSLKIKKININTCTAPQLKHPYLNWKIANGIVAYRSNHGKFSSVKELTATGLVDEATLLKIEPYLSVQH